MDQKDIIRISKFISLVLRHKPDEAGLTLDAEGWVPVSDLLPAIKLRGYDATREVLDTIVSTSDKQRFAFSPDGERIRANQGHSVEVDLNLQPIEPPETLYHGTATKLVRVIQLEGLKPMKRQHVHLSADPETATKVGRRHGKPMVLPIMAGDMHRAGSTFYRSENGVWLVDAVPAKAIDWADVRFEERLDKAAG